MATIRTRYKDALLLVIIVSIGCSFVVINGKITKKFGHTRDFFFLIMSLAVFCRAKDSISGAYGMYPLKIINGKMRFFTPF